MLHPIAGLLLLSLLADAGAQEAQDTSGEGIVWHQDFATARALAQDNGKPLFVIFRCER